jgi:hypothetical protein
MSGISKKRPGEVRNTSEVSKRSTTRSETVIIDEDEEEANFKNYDIAAKLSSTFSVFPEPLRERLQVMCEATIRYAMTALVSQKPLNFKYTYSIVTEWRVRQPISIIEPNVTTCKANMVSLSVANTALMELFLNSQKDYLKKPNFVFLQKQDGMANPDFIRLHATRHNEIGWGFDIYGCLSLFLLYIDEGKLREYVIYVNRTEVKVEEKA